MGKKRQLEIIFFKENIHPAPIWLTKWITESIYSTSTHDLKELHPAFRAVHRTDKRKLKGSGGPVQGSPVLGGPLMEGLCREAGGGVGGLLGWHMHPPGWVISWQSDSQSDRPYCYLS